MQPIIRFSRSLLFVLMLGLVGCGPSAPALPGGLVLEEHALAQAPDLDSRGFLPVEGTQEEVLARHAAERALVIPSTITMIDGYPAIRATMDGQDLLAVVVSGEDDPFAMTAQLSIDDETVFSAPAGYPSPASPLQGLWTYDGHWALEILLSTPDVWIGQVYVDGALLNDANDYAEVFGFQILAGKPFYFFSRQGQIGISYDGHEADLGFDSVPHYNCCSESVLNPIQSEEMVAFFAQRGDAWYYVELGAFE